MLTADLAMSWQRGDQIRPRYLNPDDADYLQAAAELVSLVSLHLQKRRTELQRALDDYIGVGTDYRILRGLIKLLVDRCEFDTVAPMEPAELRRSLFFRAVQHHPVLNRAAVLALVGRIEYRAGEFIGKFVCRFAGQSTIDCLRRIGCA